MRVFFIFGIFINNIYIYIGYFLYLVYSSTIYIYIYKLLLYNSKKKIKIYMKNNDILKKYREEALNFKNDHLSFTIIKAQ